MPKDKLKALEGIDAARSIRQAMKEMQAFYRTEQRKAEVDRREADVTLKVQVMVFETAGRNWRVETLADAFEGQGGQIVSLEKTEALAMAEFRMKLKDRLLESKWCRPEEARRYAALADVDVVGRVPFHRIVTK